MEAARRRNYTFFDAPLAIIVCMDKQLAEVDVMCVGMYVQALCLLLAERGVASCVQVSVAGYPDVVREELRIEEGMNVLSGIAVGFEDEGARLNRLRVERDAVAKCVEFMA
jgi:nitroreductase